MAKTKNRADHGGEQILVEFPDDLHYYHGKKLKYNLGSIPMRMCAGFFLYVGFLFLFSPVFDSGAATLVKKLSVRAGMAFVLVAALLFAWSVDTSSIMRYSTLAVAATQDILH